MPMKVRLRDKDRGKSNCVNMQYVVHGNGTFKYSFCVGPKKKTKKKKNTDCVNLRELIYWFLLVTSALQLSARFTFLIL